MEMDLSLSIGRASLEEHEENPSVGKGSSCNGKKRFFYKRDQEIFDIPSKSMKLSNSADNSIFCNPFLSGNPAPNSETIKQKLRRFLSDPIHWGNLRKQSRLYYQFSEALRSMREKNPSEILDLRCMLKNNEKITATVIKTQSRPVLQVLAYILSDETSITASRVNRLVEICLQSGHWKDSPAPSDSPLSQLKILQNGGIELPDNMKFGLSEKSDRVHSDNAVVDTSVLLKYWRESQDLSNPLKGVVEAIHTSPNDFESQLMRLYRKSEEKSNRSEQQWNAKEVGERKDSTSNFSKGEVEGLEEKIKDLKISVISSKNYAAFILNLHAKLKDRVSKLDCIAQSLELTLSSMESLSRSEENESCSISTEANGGEASIKSSPLALNFSWENNREGSHTSEDVGKDDKDFQSPKGDESNVRIKNMIDRENFINDANTKSAVFQISETMDYLEEAMENARVRVINTEKDLGHAERLLHAVIG